MPTRSIQRGRPRRQHWGVGAARAVARGAVTAYRNRGAIRSGVRRVKKVWKSLKRRFNQSGPSSKRLRRSPAMSNLAGASTQYTKTRIGMGKKRGPLSSLRKLDKHSTSYWIQRYGRVSPFNATQASFLLSNVKDATNVYFPMHIFDVSSRPDNILGGTTPVVASSLYSPLATDDMLFQTLAGLKMDGVTNTDSWEVIKRGDETAGPTIPPVVSHSVLEYVKADFILRGIAARPVTYKMALVQFQEVNLLPTSGSTAARTKFFQDFIRSSLYSPLVVEPKSFNDTGKMTVLKRWSFSFQPDETSNKDSVPTQKRVTLFANLNRFSNWIVRESLPDGDVTTLQGPELHPEYHDNTTDAPGGYLPQPRARVYLMVWADVYDQRTAFTADDVAYFPQYDLDLRVKHAHRGQFNL